MTYCIDNIELSLFACRINAICDEMGAVLRRSSCSPNIKDRLDFSCAIFDHNGELCAQAAHIPVHLGSMAYAMQSIVSGFDWQPNDMLILNDPYLGGTHLPDVTLITPIIIDSIRIGFVANRAHHADIGAETPGSMPVSSSLAEEGLLISPQFLIKAGKLQTAVMNSLLQQLSDPLASQGDFNAQISSNRKGLQRIQTLVEQTGIARYQSGLIALNEYAERLARQAIGQIPDGEYEFADVMDDDGMGQKNIFIRVKLTKNSDKVIVDFDGTDTQVKGNINCPLSVCAAAVYYVFRCLMPKQTPAVAGSFRPVELKAPMGCLLNACAPAAVAAGNVETSSRIVDVLLGALAKAIPEKIPAASHGSMNNIAMGSTQPGQQWSYYETMGGGMGAGPAGAGLSAVQTHMTNTLNTPIEVLEMSYPLRVTRYAIRRDSGGQGQQRGGDGLVREFEFLAALEVTLLTERRLHRPWGLAGAEAGKAGINLVNGIKVPGKINLSLKAGDRLTVKSAGGGGYGALPKKH